MSHETCMVLAWQSINMAPFTFVSHMACHAKACCKIPEPDYESFYDDTCT